MHIDTIPSHKVKAEGLQHSIFTGIKYCFVNVDTQNDWSWDGEELIIDWKNKAESVLFSKKELEAFAPSRNVYEFVRECNASRKAEIIELKKRVRTAKTHWTHSRISGHTCNPKQILKDRIAFLESNEIRFVEINFDI